MNSDPFFKEGMAFSVDARGLKGEIVPAEGRNSFQTLKYLAQKALVGLMLVSSMAGAMAGTVNNLQHEPAVAAPQAMEVVAKQALSNIPSVIRSKIDTFKLTTDQVNDVNGPVMTAETVRGDKTACTISVYNSQNIENIAKNFSGANYRFNDDQKMVFTRTILDHETAHCAYSTSRLSIVNDKIGESLYFAWHFAENMNSNVDEKTGFSLDVETLMSERYADGVALLQHAARAFNGNQDAKQLKESLHNFNASRDLMMQLRDSEMRMVQQEGYSFNGHDTRPALQAINKIIQEAARSPKSMEAFKAETLNSDGMALTAINIALGSVRAELPEIYRNQLTDAISEVKSTDTSAQAAEKVQSLMDLSEKVDRVIPNDVDFGEEIQTFYQAADQKFAMSNIDTARVNATAQFTSSLFKKLGTKDASNSQTRMARPGF